MIYKRHRDHDQAGAHAYRPTRSHPHRWCRTLHRICGITGLTMIVLLLTRETAPPMLVLAFIAAVGVIAVGVFSLVHGNVLDEALANELSGADRIQHVRPGWARAAAGMDLFFAAWFTAALANLLTTPPTEADTIIPSSPAAAVVNLAVGVGLVAFLWFTHRQAVRPAEVDVTEGGEPQ